MFIKETQILILGLSLIGTMLVFLNSPKVDHNVYLEASSESDKNNRSDKNKRMLASIGFGILLLAYFLQTAVVLLLND